MVRDARNAAQEEMREAADRYESCLACVETERAVLEEKLAQRDIEIVKLSVALDELKIVVENQVKIIDESSQTLTYIWMIFY